MTRYRYNRQFDPPAPFVHVTLRRPDGGEGSIEQPAQLDTAADKSVIPWRKQLVQKDLKANGDRQDFRISTAAAAVKDLYEPGNELTEWTNLDAEKVLDTSTQG